MSDHLIRYGLMGSVDRFRSADGTVFPRSSRVIVRTPRGLETGEVLAPPDEGLVPTAEPIGPVLRLMTVEDDLLAARLRARRDEAFAACTQILAEQQEPAVLVDVEHLFDGRGLFFYFLGESPPEADRLTRQLAEKYETEVAFHRFAETLSEGCGPGCGTEEAMGQGGCASCTSCAVASACSTKGGG
ncbi:MAG: PSP1 C-terminal domain-containing protein [Planctomycetota bacterium]